LAKGTASALVAGWGAATNGVYNQTINLPTNYLFANTITQCYIDNELVDLRIEKVTNTSFKVYCNDNTKQVDFLFV
jgi:hypothetical protein